MSNFKVQGNASGAGTFTLQSPNIAGNLSFTMPSADGSNGQFIQTNGSGVLSFASVTPSGVIQVKSTTKLDGFTTTSNTLVDITGLSISITPTSASNKILVIATLNAAQSDLADFPIIQLVRNSTAIATSTASGTINSTLYYSNYNFSQSPMGVTTFSLATNFLDSPATTSATTYKLQVARTSVGTVCINRRGDGSNNGTISTITVMEVTP